MIPQRVSSPGAAGTARTVKSGPFHFSPEALTSSNSLFFVSLPGRPDLRQAGGAVPSAGDAARVSAPSASESKSLASFLSAAGKDLTAFFRGHSGAEAAFAVSAQD